MPSQQYLKLLQVRRLKNLTDVIIKFDKDKRLTAILGPNGFGKSTVLHALAASFQPTQVRQDNTVSTVGEDWRYIDYFPNTPHGAWANTEFSIVHSFLEDTETLEATLIVSKGIRQWIPLAKNRPERETYFIGVSSATPEIEKVRPRSRVNYTTYDLGDVESQEIRRKAGFILNRDYTRYHTNRVTARSSLMGVEFEGVNYSALSMGAGEQRLFRLLRIVKRASKYALILIDELDLLMHTDALARLLRVLKEYAEAKKLQIIFTTHRESILEFEEFVAIRHLYRSPVAPHKTFCFQETKPDALSRLNGQPQRPLSICCEDDVATAIIEKVAAQLGLLPYIEITRFGGVDNSFLLAAALIINGEELDKTLFVIDGDRYRERAEKLIQMKKFFSGDAAIDKAKKDLAVSKIVQFLAVDGCCPEQALHTMLRGITPDNVEVEDAQVINAALQVNAVVNNHEYLDLVIGILGGERLSALQRIMNAASKSPNWDAYTQEVRAWLEGKREEVLEFL